MSDENIESPTMAQVIKDAIESRLVALHTCMPATIVSFDAQKQKASVQPNIQRKYNNGKVTSLPIINGVPVVHPRAGKAAILLPLKAGDPCLLVFAERSIDIWKSKGGQVDPQDTRKHDLSDAFCIPGGSDFTNAIAGDASDLVIVNDKTKIKVKSDGKMSFANTNTGDELIDLVHQIADKLTLATTNTVFGPQFLNNLADFTDIKTKLENLKV